MTPLQTTAKENGQLLSHFNLADTIASSDFDQLLGLIEKQSVRCNRLRIYAILTAIGNISIFLFINILIYIYFLSNDTIRAVFVHILIDNIWYIIGALLGWMSMYLFKRLLPPFRSVFTNGIKFILLLYNFIFKPFHRRVLSEDRVLSNLLQLVRETGPALEQAGLISPLKWATTKIWLTRYPI